MLLKFSFLFFAGILSNEFGSSISAPRHISSTQDGRRLEQIYRLGLDKEGIAEWSIESPDTAGRLRTSGEVPVEYIEPKGQFNGDLGNAEPPQLLSASEQFQPPQHDPPRPGLESPPGGLRSLTKSEKESIASVSFQVFYSIGPYSQSRGLDHLVVA